MEKKYCVVCGSENFSRSKLYCSVKCKNQAYYKQNRDELLESHKDWMKKNAEKARETTRKWRTEAKKEDPQYYKRWRKEDGKKEKENKNEI